MTITHPKSVLVLGAGVSEPFGMPLGGQLVDMIAGQIDQETPQTLSEDYGRKAFDANRVVDWTTAPHWHRAPIYGTVMRQCMNGQSLPHKEAFAAHEQIQQLRSLLRNQTAETIDAFIAENPGSANLAKLTLAAMMLKSTYESGRHGYGEPLKIRGLEARTLACGHRGSNSALPSTERNWIHLLINIVRHAIDEGVVTPDNKIKIVTFNYDVILEHVLNRQFRNREAPLGAYTEYFEILHVHGQVGDLAATSEDPGRTAAEWANGISVVKEKTPPEIVRVARERARQLVFEARTIYAAGFAFAGLNCRLLGLDQSGAHESRRLIYCNYDGNRGIKEAARRYARHVEEIPGEWSRPLSVSDFIRAGYLGENPS